eukprot:721122-Amorphochlora_amoeboformis.AAC.1
MSNTWTKHIHTKHPKRAHTDNISSGIRNLPSYPKISRGDPNVSYTRGIPGTTGQEGGCPWRGEGSRDGCSYATWRKTSN